MMRPATIFLGIWRRGDGLARAEEGSGEESARASAFFFEKIGGYSRIKIRVPYQFLEPRILYLLALALLAVWRA